MLLASVLIGGFEYCMDIVIHAYSLNGIHLIWRYGRDSQNCQIKATAKYTMYMVLSSVTFKVQQASYCRTNNLVAKETTIYVQNFS